MPAKQQEIQDLELESSNPDFWSDAQRAQRLMRHLGALKQQVDSWHALRRQASDLEELLVLAEADEALRAEIAAETEQALGQLERLELRLLLSGPYDEADAIVAVHAGTGGVDAQDWAEMLVRMYLRWAAQAGLQAEVLDEAEGEEAGIKSATIELRGENAYGYAKAEAGTHRLVRLSPFDAAHRRHTAFALVEVLPEVEDDTDVQINDDDLRIDTYRSSGAGGQHVNKTSSAVRITHIPTGVVATSSEKSQHENRRKAMANLKARLYDMQRQAADTARADAHKSQVGSGDRSERIRTYNFPQGRVTDHRINFTSYNLPKIMEGELDEIIDPLIAEDQAARLASLEAELA